MRTYFGISLPNRTEKDGWFVVSAALDSISGTIKYRFTDEGKDTMETAVSMTGNPDMGCTLKRIQHHITLTFQEK